MGNGWDNVNGTRDADLRAYDALPREVRDFLKYTVADWVAAGILSNLTELFVRCGSRQRALSGVRLTVQLDTEEDTYRAYGSDHPQANAHGRRLKPAANACWSPGARRAE